MSQREPLPDQSSVEVRCPECGRKLRRVSAGAAVGWGGAPTKWAGHRKNCKRKGLTATASRTSDDLNVRWRPAMATNDRGTSRVGRAVLLAVLDLLKLLVRVELIRVTFLVVRGFRRWTRVPLREREQLLWTKFIYEVVSGYGEGETEHLFPPGTYPRWFGTGVATHERI